MNDYTVVQNMIQFIEAKEREIQTDKMLGDAKTKQKSVVDSIIKQLKKECEHEDQ